MNKITFWKRIISVLLVIGLVFVSTPFDTTYATTVEETSAKKTLVEKQPVEELLTEETPTEETPTEETPTEETPTEETPTEETPTEEMLTEEMPTEEPSAEEPLAEELPAEEPPAEESLLEEILYESVESSEAESGQTVIPTEAIVLTEENITLDSPEVTYTGEVQNPEIIVTVDGYGELTKDVDYTVTPTSGEPILAGTYYYQIEGIQNFTGTVTCPYTIKPAVLTDVSVKQAETVTYNGKKLVIPIEATAKSTYNNDVVFQYSTEEDGSYSEKCNFYSDAGEYTVWFKASAESHEDYYGSFTITIEKAENSWITEPELFNLRYGGDSNLLPDAEAKARFGTVKISYSVKGKDWWYAIPIEIGSYTAKFYVKESRNYTGLETLIDFEITPWTLINQEDAVSYDSYDYWINRQKNNGWYNKDFKIFLQHSEMVYEFVYNNVGVGSVFTVSTQGENQTVEFQLRNRYSQKIAASGTYTYNMDKNIGDAASFGSVSFNHQDSWQELVNGISFDSFYKDEVTVYAEAQDGLSGVDKLEYLLSDKSMSLADLQNTFPAWKPMPESGVTVSMKDGKHFVCYVRITDKAGNYTYLSTNGAEYDITAPEISGIEDGAVYYTSQNVTVSDRNIDTVTVNGEVVEETFTLPGNVDAEYTIIATDKAGNSTTTVVTMKSLSVLLDVIKNITAENCTSEDKANLEAAAEELERRIEESQNYTEAEKEAVQKELERIQGLLAFIEKVEAMNFVILEGADETYYKGMGKEFCFVVDGALELLSGVQIDGKPVDSVNSATDSGATKVGLSVETMEALGNGTHKLEVIYEALGKTFVASCEFHVQLAQLKEVKVSQKEKLVYTGEAQTAEIVEEAVSINGQKVSFVYSANRIFYLKEVPTFVKAGEYTVWFIASAESHEDYYGSFTITIEKAENSWVTEPTISNWEYGETAPQSTAKAKFGTVIIQYKSKTGDYSSTTVPKKVGSYTAVFKVLESDNYTGLEKSIDFEITPWTLINQADNSEEFHYEIRGAVKNQNGWYQKDFEIILGKNVDREYELVYNNVGVGNFFTVSTQGENQTVEFQLRPLYSEEIIGYGSYTYNMDKNIGDAASFGSVSFNHQDSWQELVNEISFDSFYKDEVTVYAEAEDGLSGVDKLEYIAADRKMSLGEMSTSYWRPLPESGVTVSMEDGKRFVYYVRITDKAGKYTYLSTNGAEYDITAPEISGVEDGAVYYTSQNVTVSDRNIDSVTVNGEAVEETFVLPGNVDAEYTIIATDKAGNITTTVVTMKPISALFNAIKDLTAENVTGEDAEAIEAVKELLEATDTTSATDAEKQALKEALDFCTALEQVIADHKQALEEALNNQKDVTAENCTIEDKANLKAAAEELEKLIKEESQNYTKAEKEAAQKELERIKELIAFIEEVEAMSFVIVEGADTMHTKGTGKELSFVANGALELLSKVQVDGLQVDSVNATVDAKGTKVVLSAEILESLENGTHKLEVIYELRGKTFAASCEFGVQLAELKEVKVSQKEELVYTGEAQIAEVVEEAVSINGQKVSFVYSASEEGTYSKEVPAFVNAGEHTVWYMASAENHKDYRGTFVVTIQKQAVTEPVIESKVYNGKVQTADVKETEWYVVIENAGGSACGRYEVELTLKDAANYTWSTTEDSKVTLEFEIIFTENEWVKEPEIKGWTYNEKGKAPSYEAKFGEVHVKYVGKANDGTEWNSDAQPVKAGTYKAVFEVTKTADYGSLFKEVDFVIEKAKYDMNNVAWDYTVAFAYDGLEKQVSVIGLPEGVSIEGYTGNKGIVTDTYTASVILKYDVHNYQDIAVEDLLWKIENNWKPVEYSISQANAHGWLNENFVITAKEGYQISLTNTAEGEWSETLVYHAETADGNATFYLRNTTDGTISLIGTEGYKIDKTVPAGKVYFEGREGWEEFLNEITFDLFFKDEVTVKVTAADELSGIESVEYVASEQAFTLEEVKSLTDWKVLPEDGVGVTLEDAKQFVYYVRIQDAAGNVSYRSTNGAEYDTSVPTISGVEEGNVYYTTQNVTIIDRNVDTVTLNGEAVGETFSLPGNVEAVYTIVATDKAGNSTTVEIQMHSIGTFMEEVSEMDETHVTFEDKDVLETLKGVIDAMLQDEDLVDEERADLEEVLARIEDALKVLEDVSKVNDLLDALPDQVSPDEEAVAEEIAAAKRAWDDLTEYGKSLIDEQKVEKLNKLLNAVVDYKIIKGDGGKWTKGSSNGLSITVNGAVSKFKELLIDDKKVDSSHYTVTEGSTILTLKATYLDTLTVGEHKIKACYIDGQAAGTFTINAKVAVVTPTVVAASKAVATKKNTTPAKTVNTGDSFQPVLWMGILLISAVGILVIFICIKKRKNRK